MLIFVYQSQNIWFDLKRSQRMIRMVPW